MASSTKFSFIFLFCCSLFLKGTLGELICEELPEGVCSFAIASSGKRCLLENYETKEGDVKFQCGTSEEVVERMSEYIETDQCVSGCGVDRYSVGISSDALLDSQFTAKLCSPGCHQGCPNIVDLYSNMAAGEGVFLEDLCDLQRTNPHRVMLQTLLSSGAAPSPDVALSLAAASGPAPS